MRRAQRSLRARSHGTVLAWIALSSPPREADIGRNRGGQRGSVKLTKAGQWQGSWYEYRRGEDGSEIRKHRTVILGDQEQMYKSEAEAALLVRIREAGYESAEDGVAQARAREAERKQQAEDVWTFGRYCEERFLPLRRAGWRPKTRAVYDQIFAKHIVARWKDSPLASMDRVEIQNWLTGLAEAGYSRSLVGKCLTYTRAALEDAIDDGYLDRNPTRRVTVPTCTKPEDESYRTMEEVAAILREMSERDRLILRTLVLCGFRPHELFALRWQDLQGRQVLVDETLEMGSVVNVGKTRKSIGYAGIPQNLARDILAWRKSADHKSDNDFVFASAAGTPMGIGHWRKRNLKPAARRAGLAKVDIRQMRRSFATLAKQAGMDIKDISEQLRHSTIRMTADKYIKRVDESILNGLDAFDAALKEAGKEVAKKAAAKRETAAPVPAAAKASRPGS